MFAKISNGSIYTHMAAAAFPTGEESPPNNPTIVKMLMTSCRMSIISETYLLTANFPISFFYIILFGGS